MINDAFDSHCVLDSILDSYSLVSASRQRKRSLMKH